jgi:hypothetical protein
LFRDTAGTPWQNVTNQALFFRAAFFYSIP